ncbi:hypothetical protein BLOT_010442, partial [Blomia tropicalis]
MSIKLQICILRDNEFQKHIVKSIKLEISPFFLYFPIEIHYIQCSYGHSHRIALHLPNFINPKNSTQNRTFKSCHTYIWQMQCSPMGMTISILNTN